MNIKKKFNKIKEFIMNWLEQIERDANEEKKKDALSDMFNGILYGTRKDEWGDF